MSDRTDGRQHPDPAVGVLEFESISAGLVAADAMVKSAPVGSIYAGTVHPGKYVVLISGDTASVEVALDRGRTAANLQPLDEAFLPDIHPAVTARAVSPAYNAGFSGEALGIVESVSIASLFRAADAGVKAAEVELVSMRLADDLGGKGYALFTGSVGDVEAAVLAAADRLEQAGTLVRSDVIPQFDPEMITNLGADLRFLARIHTRGGT